MEPLAVQMMPSNWSSSQLPLILLKSRNLSLNINFQGIIVDAVGKDLGL